MPVKPGNPIPLALQLLDEEIAAFPRVLLRDAAGTPLGASPVSLAHLANGLYRDTSVVMPATDRVYAQFQVFADAGHTIRHPVHPDTLLEVFERDFILEKLDALLLGAIPGQELLGYVEEAGELLGFIEDSNELVGFLESDSELVGFVMEFEPEEEVLEGFLEDPGNELVGFIEC